MRSEMLASKHDAHSCVFCLHNPLYAMLNRCAMKDVNQYHQVLSTLVDQKGCQANSMQRRSTVFLA